MLGILIEPCKAEQEDIQTKSLGMLCLSLTCLVFFVHGPVTGRTGHNMMTLRAKTSQSKVGVRTVESKIYNLKVMEFGILSFSEAARMRTKIVFVAQKHECLVFTLSIQKQNPSSLHSQLEPPVSRLNTMFQPNKCESVLAH